MPVLMLFEPHCSGHRMQYVKWIARSAVADGYDVQLATFPESLSHPLYLAMQEECQGRVKVMILPGNEELRKGRLLDRCGLSNLVKRELTYRRSYATFFRQLLPHQRPDFVFVPYLDYCSHAVALLGSPFGEVTWGGIVMRPSFHLEPMGIPGPYSRLHRIKEKLFLRLFRDKRLKALFSIDEALVRYVQQIRPGLSKRLRFLPDPAELSGTVPRESSRQRLGIPDDAMVVLVYGSLTLRKGIDTLLRAAEEHNFPREVHILLAGRQDREVRALLLSSPAKALREAGRLHEQDRFLSEEDEYMVFKASDVVWLGYRGHYAMSGVLVQAGMMGLPVVACAEGVVGWLTLKHELGVAVSVDDVEAVSRAIAELAGSPEAAASYGENGKHFSALHTAEDFSRAINRSLQTWAAPVEIPNSEISNYRKTLT